ncbi:MAG: alpha/beta hydrolase [Planctomycetota bacterium]
MKRRLIILFVLFDFLVFGAIGGYFVYQKLTYEPPRKPMRPTQIVPYKTTPQAELKLHLFEPYEGQEPGPAGHPAVVFFHGGGWEQGDAKHFYPQADWLARRGVFVINTEYRVEFTHGTTPFESVKDAISTMRFVKQHAEAWGIDPDRIAAGGASAGGHLAAALATLTAPDLDEDDFSGNEEQRIASYRPDALLLFNPVIDNGPGEYGHDRIGDRYPDFSPAHNLHADVPPTLNLLGDRDDIISVPTTRRFHDRLTELGVPNQLIVYPGEEHGFFNYGRNDDRGYDATLVAVQEFLTGLNWISGETP